MDAVNLAYVVILSIHTMLMVHRLMVIVSITANLICWGLVRLTDLKIKLKSIDPTWCGRTRWTEETGRGIVWPVVWLCKVGGLWKNGRFEYHSDGIDSRRKWFESDSDRWWRLRCEIRTTSRQAIAPMRRSNGSTAVRSAWIWCGARYIAGGAREKDSTCRRRMFANILVSVETKCLVIFPWPKSMDSGRQSCGRLLPHTVRSLSAPCACGGQFASCSRRIAWLPFFASAPRGDRLPYDTPLCRL